MTAKKADKATEPVPFNWLSLSQPTPHADDTSWEVQQPPEGNSEGPWWVQDANGNQFATYVLLKGLTPLKESPFTRSGELRTPNSGGIDTAPAE